MNLFDILADNHRVIVWSEAETGLLYTWNGSATLQCFSQGYEWGFEEIDIRTLSEVPATFRDAQDQAHQWHTER